MKKVKFLLVFVLTACFVILNQNFVSAKDWELKAPTGRLQQIAAPIVWKGGNGAVVSDADRPIGIELFILKNKKTGQEREAFCIERGVYTDYGYEYDGNSSYDYWNNVISEKSKNNIRIAMDWYLDAIDGASVSRHSALQGAMQVYIWHMTLNDWKGGGSGSIDWAASQKIIDTNNPPLTVVSGGWNPTHHSNMKKFYDQIVDYVAKHQVEGSENPTLDKTSVTLSPGESVTITDTKGVLSKSGWTIDTKDLPEGIEVTKSGNKITVTVTSSYTQGVWSGSVPLKYTSGATGNREEIVFFSDQKYEGKNIQTLIYPGSPKGGSASSSFNIEIVPGKIHLVKNDKETTIKVQGDAKFEGAVYGVYDSNGKEVQRLTIKADATAVTDYLPLGVYTVKELVPPKGYNLSNETYRVEITSSSLEPTLTVYDNVIKGNLEITKRLGQTDYDAEINLAGAQFKVVLKSAIGTAEEASKTYYTNVSSQDGICKVEGLPYGVYVVEENIVPNEAYKIANFEINIEEERTYSLTKVDSSKEMRISINKVLLDKTVGKTDAKVSGAYFTVYTNADATEPYIDKNGRTVVIGPTNAEGYAISGTMRTGTYYLKETIFPEGINPDAIVPGDTITYKEKVYEASYNNVNQGEDIVTVNLENLVNIPNFGKVEILKYKDSTDASDESPAKGAKLRLTLISSNGSVYYDAVINDNGYAEFVNEELRDPYYPYTIPYGKYEITELDEGGDGHKYFFVQAERIDIVNDDQEERRILADNPVPAWLKIVKKDNVSGQVVRLEGAKYKIWDLQENKFVEQMSYNDGGKISEFETNEEGYLVTPEKVEPGEYVIYETKAPAGYYLDDEWRLPQNSSDYGKVGGKKIKVDKITTGLAEDTTYPEGGVVTGQIVLETTIYNTPLTVNLELYKTAEKFTGAKTEKVTYPVSESEEKTEDLYTPMYKKLPLQGVGYRIYAVADTYTPDGIKRYSKDQMVADITTDENGYAVAKKLFPGEYRIEEYKTPKGYLKDENIPNVVLENEDEYLETATVKKELTDVRQKLGLTFKKKYEEVKYSDEEELVQKSLFGVYTKETLNNYQGTATISRNSLVDLIWADSENNVISKADLPEGTYYVKELYVTYPYNIDTNTYDYNLAYSNDATQKEVIIRGKNLVNTTNSTSITLVKIGTTTVSDLILNGNIIDTSNLDKEVSDIIEKINGKTKDEIREYFKENNVKSVSGAEYGIYTDEACTKSLKVKNNETGKYEDVTLTSDELGLITLNDIPIRTYYLKEIKAPKGYEISKDIVKVELDNVNKDAMVYDAMIEKEVVQAVITKTDIFTGELVPKCTFEIRDSEGNLLLKSITNEEGKAYIPVVLFENGKTYTYTEVEAPKIYELNKEPHEFVAEIDEEGNWVADTIKVENIRKTSTVTLTKLDMVDSKVIPNCKFVLQSLDNPDWKEEGVTDENGVYVFENVPYGKYTYTELEAPEEYLIDTEPHEITIDAEDVKIVVKDDRAPETGDIAVIAIAVIAVVCVLGIAFVIVRNKKKK